MVIVTLATTLAVSYSIAERDISWISQVENWIKEENREPDREYIPMMLSAFFLYTNGEKQFFRLYSHHNFSSYIRGLVNDVDRRIDYLSMQFFLDEILTKNKVLEFTGRFPFDFGLLNKYRAAFFILEDNLDMNLEGTIIIFDIKGRLGVWEITKWFL